MGESRVCCHWAHSSLHGLQLRESLITAFCLYLGTYTVNGRHHNGGLGGEQIQTGFERSFYDTWLMMIGTPPGTPLNF